MLALRSTPKYSVKIDGQPLPGPLANALKAIVVDQAVDMADHFTLVFENERARASDDPQLKPGKRVDVELGYEEGGGRTQSVMDGEIVALKAVFPRRGAPLLRVQGYTKYHRLMRGRHTRALNGLSFSGIAQRIAQEVGLEARVDPTNPAIEAVFQRNQTNLELLLELAARVGYEVFAGDGKLFFRKPTPDGAKVRTLKKGETLLSFNPRVRAALIPTQVDVIGWNPGKVMVAGLADGEADMGPTMGGKTSAVKVAEKLRPARQQIRGLLVRDDAEAKAIAQASLRAAAQNLVEAVAQVPGMADLRPGLVVEVADVGDIFSGTYYIRRVVHNFTKGGFATSLKLSRSSVEKAPVAPSSAQRPEAPARPPAEPGQVIRARLVDEATGRPFANARYEVLAPNGQRFATGTTDWQGGLEHRVPEGGQYIVRALPSEASAGGGGGEGAGQTGQTARREGASADRPARSSRRGSRS